MEKVYPRNTTKFYIDLSGSGTTLYHSTLETQEVIFAHDIIYSIEEKLEDSKDFIKITDPFIVNNCDYNTNIDYDYYLIKKADIQKVQVYEIKD